MEWDDLLRRSLRESNSDANGHSNSYAHTDSYTDGDSNGYAYTDSNADGDSNSYAYTDSYGNCDGDSYAYTDSYAYVDAYGPAETKPDTEAISDAASSSVGATRKRLCGNSRENLASSRAKVD
jgi:serine-aspartate repeat-containing protein C/D/E